MAEAAISACGSSARYAHDNVIFIGPENIHGTQLPVNIGQRMSNYAGLCAIATIELVGFSGEPIRISSGGDNRVVQIAQRVTSGAGLFSIFLLPRRFPPMLTP